MSPVVLFLLVLSGSSSLIYQVTWVRLLGLSLGSTSASVGTVLAAFFLGLSLGSYLAEFFTRRSPGSLVPYIAVEILIGVSGLVSLPVLLNLDYVLLLAPAFGDSLVFKFLLSIGFLIVPTTCMGATFPIMAGVMIRNRGQVGAHISQLYGFNTLGAVLGAALGGFLLIPRWGLDGSIMVAAAANFGVALIAVALWLSTRGSPAPRLEYAEPATEVGMPVSRPIVWLSAGSLILTGFGSIAVQVGWTKYLALFTGSTVYGFSAILTVFLVGITAGSLLFQRRIDRLRSPETWLPIMLVALGLSMIGTRIGMSLLPALQAHLNGLELGSWPDSVARYVAVALVIFPTTFLLGAIFPLNLKLYCGDLQGVRRRIGQAYAINTVAGIGGAIFAGFVAIPAFGTDKLLAGIAVATGFSALAWLSVVRRPLPSVAAVLGAGVIAISTWLIPGIDYRTMISTVGYDEKSRTGEAPEFLFLEEGKAGVISLTTYDGLNVRLQNNGLNESRFQIGSDVFSQRAEIMLGLVPYALHQDPRSALVVGFGGGHTVRGLSLTGIDRIKVVELEPAVVNAGRSIGGFVQAVLQDDRVELKFNDARNELLLGREKFDLIVSQPSHPWVAGAANVFTQQFWDIGAGSLKPGGIFAQWINLFSMDPETLKSLLAAFYTSFQHGFVMADLSDGNLIAIGSGSAVNIDLDRISKIFGSSAVAKLSQPLGISSAEDILWYFAFSREKAKEISAGATPNLDTNLISEVRLAALGRNASDKNATYEFVRAARTLDAAEFLDQSSRSQLASLGQYFLDYDWPTRASEVAELMRPDRPLQADEITFRALLASNRYAEAFALFATRVDWADNVIAENITALLRVGMAATAAPLVSLIEDSRIRLEQQSRILYANQFYDEVVSLNPRQMASDVWYLLALAHSDLERAYDLLVDNANIPAAARIDVALTLLRYSIMQERRPESLRYARQLDTATSKEVDALLAIASAHQKAEGPELIDAIRRKVLDLDQHRSFPAEKS